MKRRTRFAILAVAGTAVLMGWCAMRGPAALKQASTQPPDASSAAADPSGGDRVREASRRAVALPERRTLSAVPRRALEFRARTGGPYDDDPQHQNVRREIFDMLLAFREEASLDDVQWRWFLAELQETAISFGYLINDRGFNRIDHEDWAPIAAELRRDLEERLSQHLTERQLGTFRFRFSAVDFPAQLARGNILQDPDDPDRKAWTIPNDIVLPNDVPLPLDAPRQNL